MFGLGVPELLVVMVIGLVLFGKNLPTLARSNTLDNIGIVVRRSTTLCT